MRESAQLAVGFFDGYRGRPDPAGYPHSRLTKREFEVLLMIVGGERQKHIADRLSLSIKTVSTHKTRILQKMGMSNVAQLVRYAVIHGLDG